MCDVYHIERDEDVTVRVWWQTLYGWEIANVGWRLNQDNKEEKELHGSKSMWFMQRRYVYWGNLLRRGWVWFKPFYKERQFIQINLIFESGVVLLWVDGTFMWPQIEAEEQKKNKKKRNALGLCRDSYFIYPVIKVYN